MNNKVLLMKVISAIVLFQGFLQGVSLFIVVANYNRIEQKHMIIFWVGCILSGIYVLFSFIGGIAGLKRQKRAKYCGIILLCCCVVIIGINAIGNAFAVNQLLSLLIPVVFLLIANIQNY